MHVGFSNTCTELHVPSSCPVGASFVEFSVISESVAAVNFRPSVVIADQGSCLIRELSTCSSRSCPARSRGSQISSSPQTEAVDGYRNFKLYFFPPFGFFKKKF